MTENALIRECEAVRSAAGIYNAAAYGQFLVTGQDAPGFLHRMLSNEVQKLEILEGRYQGLLDRKGMTLSLFYLLRLGEQEFLALTPPQLTGKTLNLLTKMKFIERVVIQDATAERGLLQVAGPKAESILKKWISFEALKPNRAQRLPEETLIWLEDFFEVPFINLCGSRAQIEKIAKELPPNLLFLNDNTMKLLRMRAGFPDYGVDLDESHILLEAALPYTYQRQKGCYPGQEVVERILAYGKGRTPKRLCRLTAAGEVSLEKGTEIAASDGTKAGNVTSAMFDPLEGTTLVLGYLENKFVDGAKETVLRNGKLFLN